ncbi:Type I restriction enzyme specificity protein MG438 [Weeksella virosa]|uniref:restriction endonuclease subunit S n=1 Tax=Weeksella virosa TaxID=1014 RepID=UPI000E04E8E2|nr:restriction endonuclease subunit S [Weeksella virosa]SUP53182.1 Type I restriction enzyme specificity protein MG438 [Weeksella virosa]
MENNWKEYRFSDFVKINPSVTLKANEEYSFVEMKDLEDGNKYCFPKIKKIKGGGAKFQNGDTLFARITPCLENGKICQVKGLENNLGFGSTEFYVFRGKENISDTEFVYYLSRWNDVRDHAEINLDGTSGRQRVPKASFDDLQLLMPPLPEQKAIASLLSSLDDKIDLLHQQNQTLETLAETLFRQWFIEEAKEDWEVVKLGDLINIRSGKGLKKESFIESGLYPILGANGEIGRTNNFLFDEKIIYTGRVGTLGNVFRVENEKVWISDNTLVIKPFYYYNFIYFVLKTSKLENYDVGSTQPLIRQSDIKEIQIKIPSSEKLIMFENLVNNYFIKIKENSKQIQTLTKLRDTLLPKLMSGEVRVKM